jgi:hypothetical protein
MWDKLENQLSEKEWGEANKTTRLLLCSFAKRSSGSLTIDEIKNISCSDLKQIDRYWVKHSNNRFGFSVQKKIWLSKGYDALISETNWSAEQFFLDVGFSLNSPVGQLPYLGASRFWEVPATLTHSSLSKLHQPHIHQPHHHYHPPHRHSHGGDAAAAGGLGAMLVAAAPWLLGAAAVGAAGYGVWWLATKEERDQKRREEERRDQQERERREREVKQEVKQKVEALLYRM